MLQRVAAAVLDVRPDRIVVRRADTAEALRDPGTGGSWVTHVVGRAVHQAATKLRERIEVQIAASEGNATFESVAEALCRNGDIETVGTYGAEGDDDFSFCAYAVEVDVDSATGTVRVVDAVVVCDVARIINPNGHQAQIDGGFAAGIGSALMEELAIDESGKVQTLSLGEYKLPTMRDAQGPFGTKMAGELSNSGVAPAIANAVFDAAGVRIDRFPITSERVYRALHPEL